MSGYFKSCLILSLLLLSIPVFACRPLATDDCPTVEIGKWEIETGFICETPNGGSAENGLAVQVKTGILKQADLGIELPYRFSDVAGFEDVILHAKYRLSGLDDEGVSLRADVKLATGDQLKDLSSGNTDVTFFVLNSFKLAQFTAHFNLGYTVIGGNGEADFWQSSFALECPLNDKLSGVSEVAWSNSAIAVNPVNILLGGYYAITEAVTIDGAVNIGLTDSAPRNVATLGVTVSL